MSESAADALTRDGLTPWIDYYQEHFAVEHDDLDRILDDGETNFARIIARLLCARFARQQAFIRTIKNKDDGAEFVTYMAASPDHVFTDTLPTDVRCYWQTAGPHGDLEVPAYIRPDDFLPRFLADYVSRQNIDAVVELGGGWGRVLFQAWLEGMPVNVPLYCLDTSESAEVMFGKLHARAPEIDVTFVRGNARANDLAFVGKVKRLLIVTSGYVIMDPDISASDIELWARAAPVIQCANLEPVGFQARQEGTAAAAHDSILAERVRRRGMNETYMRHLLKLQDDGVLRVSNFRKHYLFDTNPVMPKSFIFWRTD